MELLWYKVEDLLNPSQERDTRHEVKEADTELYQYCSSQTIYLRDYTVSIHIFIYQKLYRIGCIYNLSYTSPVVTYQL